MYRNQNKRQYGVFHIVFCFWDYFGSIVCWTHYWSKIIFCLSVIDCIDPLIERASPSLKLSRAEDSEDEGEDRHGFFVVKWTELINILYLIKTAGIGLCKSRHDNGNWSRMAAHQVCNWLGTPLITLDDPVFFTRNILFISSIHIIHNVCLSVCHDFRAFITYPPYVRLRLDRGLMRTLEYDVETFRSIGQGGPKI